MKEKRSYVAILPDKTESFHDVMWDMQNPRWNDGAILAVAESAVRQSDIKANRKNPVPIRVTVYRLAIEKGQIKRDGLQTFDIVPPLQPMTEVEFKQEMTAAVEGLPKEFAEYVTRKAWEDGHANGYEEVVSIAVNMASELKPVIEAYTDRIGKKRVLPGF